MDIAIKDEIFKFHPDTVMAVRKLHNLDKPGDMDQLVDSLRDWLKKQHHLTKKEYSREFLERSIIQMKGSVERAKAQIDKLCSLRALLPKFFEKCDAINDFEDICKIGALVFLPQLTKEYYRVLALKVFNKGLTKHVSFKTMAYGTLLCEYMKAHDYCDGLVVAFDYTDVDATEFLASVDFIDVHSMLTIFMHGYGLRLKGIHIVMKSKAAKRVMETIRGMFGKKVASRFFIHDDIQQLYKYLPKNILPSDFGGDEKSMATLAEEWRNVLGSKANVEYFREMSQAVSNEAYKMKEDLNLTDLGLAGTFRTLNVD